MDEHLMEAIRLQQVLRGQCTSLDDIELETPAYAAQLGQVFTAAARLVEYEQEIPILRDEQRRRISSGVIYATTAAAAATMVVIGVLAGVGAVSRGYLVPVVLVLLVTAAMAGMERTAGRAGHRSRMVAAIIAAVAAVLVAVIVAHVLSAFFLFVALPVLLAASLVWIMSDAGVTA